MWLDERRVHWKGGRGKQTQVSRKYSKRVSSHRQTDACSFPMDTRGDERLGVGILPREVRGEPLMVFIVAALNHIKPSTAQNVRENIVQGKKGLGRRTARNAACNIAASRSGCAKFHGGESCSGKKKKPQRKKTTGH